MGLGLKVHVGHVLGLEHDLGLGVDPSYKPCWDHISSSLKLQQIQSVHLVFNRLISLKLSEINRLI